MSGLRQEGQGLGELIGTLITDLGDLVRGELRLARAEMDQKIEKLLASAISLVGGALVAFAGLVVLLEGGAAALSRIVPAWAALVIVGVVIIVVGGLIARAALAGMSLKGLTPEHSAASLQKDVRVIKEHT